MNSPLDVVGFKVISITRADFVRFTFSTILTSILFGFVNSKLN